MALFKCKICGGTIEFEQGATVGVCNSCGTKQTLNHQDDIKRANFSARKDARVILQYRLEKMKSAKAGDTVIFGAYYQDNDTSKTKTEIEWLLLAKQDNKVLLISDKSLDCKPFYTQHTGFTWDKSPLRLWMNGAFLHDAFSTEEQVKISKTNISADKNPDFSTDPGYKTTDKVFLLSIIEAKKYFGSDAERKCIPTEYALSNGAFTYIYNKGTADTCWWWLRSPGWDRHYVSAVYFDGSVLTSGHDGFDNFIGFRPALWITLDY